MISCSPRKHTLIAKIIKDEIKFHYINPTTICLRAKIKIVGYKINVSYSFINTQV